MIRQPSASKSAVLRNLGGIQHPKPVLAQNFANGTWFETLFEHPFCEAGVAGGIEILQATTSAHQIEPDANVIVTHKTNDMLKLLHPVVDGRQRCARVDHLLLACPPRTSIAVTTAVTPLTGPPIM